MLWLVQICRACNPCRMSKGRCSWNDLYTRLSLKRARSKGVSRREKKRGTFCSRKQLHCPATRSSPYTKACKAPWLRARFWICSHAKTAQMLADSESTWKIGPANKFNISGLPWAQQGLLPRTKRPFREARFPILDVRVTAATSHFLWVLAWLPADGILPQAAAVQTSRWLLRNHNRRLSFRHKTLAVNALCWFWYRRCCCEIQGIALGVWQQVQII